jgi:hypothetical protein
MAILSKNEMMEDMLRRFRGSRYHTQARLCSQIDCPVNMDDIVAEHVAAA